MKISIFTKFKFWQKNKIPPRWFIITLRFHPNSKVKIFQNWSQYWRTILTNFFQNFEVDTKIPKSPKLAQITKILKKKFLKPLTDAPSCASRNLVCTKTAAQIWSCSRMATNPWKMIKYFYPLGFGAVARQW